MFWENHILLRFNKQSFKRKKLLDSIILVLLTFMLITCVSTANAASNRLIDNANVLAEYQYDNIQIELSSLKGLNLVIVINNVGTRCTDDYAYTLAKSLCQETFLSDEKSMVLAYCSSLEGYKIGIYYQGDLDIDTKNLKDNIVSDYVLYSTDSSWIEGSAIQFINRIREILDPSVDSTPKAILQEEQPLRKVNFWETYGKYQLIASVIFAVFVSGAILAVLIYKKHRKQIEKDIDYWFRDKKED